MLSGADRPISEQERVMRHYAEPPVNDPIWAAWKKEADLRAERERAEARRDKRQLAFLLIQEAK